MSDLETRAAAPVTHVSVLSVVAGLVFAVIAGGLVLTPEILGLASVANFVIAPVAVIVLGLVAAFVFRPRG